MFSFKHNRNHPLAFLAAFKSKQSTYLFKKNPNLLVDRTANIWHLLQLEVYGKEDLNNHKTEKFKKEMGVVCIGKRCKREKCER